MENRRVTLAQGEQGLKSAKGYTVCVIVDVLSFSTSVVTACEAGAFVYPLRWKDERAQTFAASLDARLAVQRQDAQPGDVSLSPSSLANLTNGTRIVLPSPNGATLSVAAQAPVILAGCLRNAEATSNYVAEESSGNILVVSAGERWSDGSLRPALEDTIGAGAIINILNEAPDISLDIESVAALTLYQRFKSSLPETLENTVSGQELIDRGFSKDVAFASRADSSLCVPRLKDGAYSSVS